MSARHFVESERDRRFLMLAGGASLATAVYLFAAGGVAAPHGYCFRWSSALMLVHGVADAAIAFAYFLIPMSFLYALHGLRWRIAALRLMVRWAIIPEQRPPDVTWFLRWFGLFILSCGLTHVLNVIELVTPIYAWSGAVKTWTALVSLRTARQLMPVVYRAMHEAQQQEEEAGHATP